MGQARCGISCNGSALPADDSTEVIIERGRSRRTKAVAPMSAALSGNLPGTILTRFDSGTSSRLINVCRSYEAMSGSKKIGLAPN